MELNDLNGKTRLFQGVGIALSLILLLSGPVQAQQVLTDLDEPIQADLQTPVNAETAEAGQVFDATLDEAVQYKTWSLPAGTTFHGHISKMKPSRSFSRAGYVRLQVDEARLPDGQVFTFDPNQYEPRTKKLHNPEATTFGRTVVEQIPYTTATLATSIPLRTATDLNGGVIFAIAAGARMAMGVTLALFDDDLAGQPLPTKIAKGAWQGTAIPRIYDFLLVKDPNPNFQPGDGINLYFDPDGLEALFKTQNSLSRNQ